MKVKILKIIWGVILVPLAGLLLAAMMGYVNFDRNPAKTALIVFICLSAASFVSYFLSGIKNWGWLFPALFSAAVALTVARVFAYDGNPVKAFPFLFSFAIPFYVGYILNRKQWELLVPAWFLTIIAVLPPLIDRINPDVLIALVLYAISLPFLVGYLVNQRCKWALFISAVLGFIGIFSLVEIFIHGNILGPMVMLLIALPFFITFSASKKRWWALIPSGVFISIGLIALLDRQLPVYEYILVGDHQVGFYTGLLLLGVAVTFAILWRLDTARPKEWARYPAIGLLAVSLLAFVLGESFDNFLLVVALLTVGIVMLSSGILKRGKTHQPSS
jgi:hypothetical protein